MTTKHACAVFVWFVLSSALTHGQIDPPPTPAEFAEQIRRLDPKNGKAERFQALRWIGQHAHHNATRAIPALENCIRKDPDGELRQRAVSGLCSVAHRLKRPLPLAALEALHDPVDEVSWTVVAWAGTFKEYAPGATEVLLRGVKSEKAGRRSNALLLLGRAAGKDAKAIDAIEQAKRDKVFDVRHSAHIALFRARDRLDEYLPYLIRLREDPAAVLSPVAEDSQQGKQERMQRNLFALGIGIQLIEWSDQRPDELAGALLKFLKDELPVMRRGAANLIAATAVKVELPKKRDGNPLDGPFGGDGGSMRLLWPFIEEGQRYTLPADGDGKSPLFRTPSAKPEKPAEPKKEKPTEPKKEKPAEKSKVALRLEKLNVGPELRRLRDQDPDRSVREAARLALERLAQVNAKKR